MNEELNFKFNFDGQIYGVVKKGDRVSVWKHEHESAELLIFGSWKNNHLIPQNHPQAKMDNGLVMLLENEITKRSCRVN